MTEIADAINLSQPAVTKILNRMSKNGYIKVSIDRYDHRRKLLQLTNKAKKNLPMFEEIWKAGQKSVREILKDNKDFINCLEAFETEIYKKSFCKRALGHLNKSK